jgi:DHA1 family multidrug resistance protein-like MFS transporter
MYEDLGTEWATSVFAILAAVLTPVPFVFYVYGRKVRERCQYTVRD